MYISILDYSRQSVTIINDTENAFAGLQTEDAELVLSVLGFKGSEISFMVTDEDPYEQVDSYVTLKELCEDVDEGRIDELQQYLNITK